MFRAKKMTRVPVERGRVTYRSSGAKYRGSGGAGRVASGRVAKKTVLPRAVSPRSKLEFLRLKLAEKGIQYDANYIERQRRVWKGEKSPVVAEDVTLYKQKMSVTPDPERKCTEDEIDKIQDAILDALEPLEDGSFPQFHGSYTVKGVLVMSCANEQTKLWLETTVPKLQPWEGGKLCVKPKGEVSRGTKVLLKTPKLFAKTDPKKILQMLNTQNKTLETNTWKTVSAKSGDTSQTLIYIVDNRSLEAIQALNNKVFLGLNNVELVILNEEEEGDKKTSVDKKKKIQDDDDKQTSVDTEMRNQEEEDKQTSEDTEMKNQEDDKQTSVEKEIKNQDDDKETSEDTEMKNQEEDDKQTSVTMEMKNQDDSKKLSEDTEMKNQDDDKKTSEDTEMKKTEEDDKWTSVDTDVAPSERT